TLKLAIDNTLLNTTSIDVMNLIDSPFKIVDLFTDTTGDNNTVDTANTTAYYFDTIDSYLSTPLISTIILEPGFETVSNWIYSESGDPNNTSGGVVTSWKTEGTYSYQLVHSGAAGESTYNQILQNVDFTNISNLFIDYSIFFNGNSTYNVRADVLVGETILKSILSTRTTNITVSGTWNIDVSSITGNQDLIFRLYKPSEVSGSAEFRIDNIRTNFSDTLIQSSSQSVGTGYSFAMVRPKLYESIPSGATITCNVSLDGGSTFTSESNINEIIDLSGLTDTGNLVVKLNLNTDGTVTSKVSGWACVLFE
ncbi:MAG TPA: hypothetical protein PL042_01615, partial [Caldisericia bacterium]|nr:hypothetical protein [Caldisericia bacterium]